MHKLYVWKLYVVFYDAQGGWGTATVETKTEFLKSCNLATLQVLKHKSICVQ